MRSDDGDSNENVKKAIGFWPVYIDVGDPDRWGNPLRCGKKTNSRLHASYNSAKQGFTFSRLLNGR